MRKLIKGNGTPGAIRTPDPQIRSLVLYPAELRVPALMKADTYSEESGDASLFATQVSFLCSGLRGGRRNARYRADPA